MLNGHLATPTTRNVQKPAENEGGFEQRTTGDTRSGKEPALLLRRLDVCQLVNIKPRTFDRLLATGQFPTADIVLNSKLIRWRRSTVENWIESGGK
jgi:predicted DNA-binding transcriptional regulator AlpA